MLPLIMHSADGAWTGTDAPCPDVPVIKVDASGLSGRGLTGIEARYMHFLQCREALTPGGALTLHLGSPTADPGRVSELAQRLNSVFRIVRPSTMYIPLYGALWALAVCSDQLDPKALTADEIERSYAAKSG